MNNREKRKYISDLNTFNSIPFMCEFETRKDFLKQTPTSLFKYRHFDKYSFEMIKDSYAFLAPVSGLDDPFDCLNQSGIQEFYDPDKGGLTPKGLKYVIRLVASKGLPSGMSEAQLKKLATDSMNGSEIDYDIAVSHPFAREALPEEQVGAFLGTMRTFNENLPGVLENKAWESFSENALFPGDKVGVCSLSEVRDNKPMWSLYGGNYSGYCIEYEIPKERDLILNLCPVIYTKRANNSLIKKMLEYAIFAMMRGFSSGRITGNIGAIMELFCTKDTDWAYQKEWRIIGKAAERCSLMKIKAIYLGFKVSQRNISRMKCLAKEKGCTLFKMNPPDGSKRITYIKVDIKGNNKQ